MVFGSLSSALCVPWIREFKINYYFHYQRLTLAATTARAVLSSSRHGILPVRLFWTRYSRKSERCWNFSQRRIRKLIRWTKKGTNHSAILPIRFLREKWKQTETENKKRKKEKNEDERIRSKEIKHNKNSEKIKNVFGKKFLSKYRFYL